MEGLHLSREKDILDIAEGPESYLEELKFVLSALSILIV